jgi:hypothetical protein
MPHFAMDCYFRSTRGGAPELRERVMIRAPARSIAIEEALRRAEFLRPNYFEVRDSAQLDTLLYNSMTDEGRRHASHAPDSVPPCAVSSQPALPAAIATPPAPSSAPSPAAPKAGARKPLVAMAFKTLDEFQRWFDAQMASHKQAPFPLLQAAMKMKAAKRKSLPGQAAGGASEPSSGSDKTVQPPHSRKRNSPRNGRASVSPPSA